MNEVTYSVQSTSYVCSYSLLDSAITNTVIYANGKWDDALISNRDGGSYVMIEKKFAAN